MIVKHGFYLSSDVVSVARQLLGKYVVTETDGIVSEGMIVETEAYRAPDDKACHAYGNRYTDRTKTMFEEGGTAYIYTCYGIHPMFNVVTGAAGMAHAILIRAVSLSGPTEHYTNRRRISKFSPVLANGPGKLAVALGINKTMDGLKIYLDDSPLRIEDRSVVIDDGDIISSCRVGMSIHTGPSAHRPWRFYIKNNPWVSKPLFPDYRALIPGSSDEIY